MTQAERVALYNQYEWIAMGERGYDCVDCPLNIPPVGCRVSGYDTFVDSNMRLACPTYSSIFKTTKGNRRIKL